MVLVVLPKKVVDAVNLFEIRKWIDGKQKVIGYEVTYESALAFLCEYNKNPLLFSPSEITFDELFCLVKAYLYPRIKEHTQSSYNCAYKHLNRLYDKQFAKIRIGDLQSAIVIYMIMVLDIVHKRKLDKFYITCIAMP